MRLRRLCETKSKTKKCHVDDATHQQYMRGGGDREWLEMALLETLQKLGANAKHTKGTHKTIVVPNLNLNRRLYDSMITAEPHNVRSLYPRNSTQGHVQGPGGSYPRTNGTQRAGG